MPDSGVAEQRLSEIDLNQLTSRPFFPSPVAWEDQVLYFLMLDRFSDGRERDYIDNDGQLVTEGDTPRFQPGDAENAVQSEAAAAAWREAGARFVGCTLKGLTSKVGYLKRLGVSAIWVSPIFKQVRSQESYHGYGIQHFLDVDPRFGTREDLRELVTTAHNHGIYVILDIIFNHAGDVFEYDLPSPRYHQGQQYSVRGFRDRGGAPSLPFGPIDLAAQPAAWPDGAIWPAEFQAAATFTRKGQITSWDNWPEYLEGDFFTLKDIDHGQGDPDHFQPSATLKHICAVYKFWIAYADIDGFRIDTVKHMEPGASRFFASVIHEFTQRIGKENFYLIGEITGGRANAFRLLGLTGLDAALGVDDIPDKLEYLVKGYRNPVEYFSLFRNSELVDRGSHTWFRNKVVTMFDDHDQVRKGDYKARFCADQRAEAVLLNVLALNITTMGIPCIYYGSEQYFDGQGGNDRYIRESMFGGAFGAFRSQGRHFFNEDSYAYKELAKIIAIQRSQPALRRGRQYLREISGDGVHFGLPQMFGGQIRSLVPWSRLFDDQELVLAINTDYDHPRTAWVTVDNELHPVGRQFRCLYATDAAQIGTTTTVAARNGKAIALTVPAAGFVIYEAI